MSGSLGTHPSPATAHAIRASRVSGSKTYSCSPICARSGMSGESHGPDFTEETLTSMEKELFYEGEYLLDPAVWGWRRLGVKLLTLLQMAMSTRLIKRLAPGAHNIIEIDKNPHMDENGQCTHPVTARRSGGNQYGSYVHCTICKTRLEFHRKTKEEIQAQRELRKTEKERTQCEAREYVDPLRTKPFMPPRRFEAPEFKAPPSKAHPARSTGRSLPQIREHDGEHQTIQEQLQELRATIMQQNQDISNQMSEMTQLLRVLVTNQAQSSDGH